MKEKLIRKNYEWVLPLSDEVIEKLEIDVENDIFNIEIQGESLIIKIKPK